MKIKALFFIVIFIASYFSVCNRECRQIHRSKTDILFPVKIDNKWGFIDKAGKIVIQPQYDRANRFYEGLAAVKIDEKYGFVDTTGNLVIEFLFDDVGHFSEGLAWVNIGRTRGEHGRPDKCGYINKEGRLVIDFIFENAGEFSEGLAWVYISDSIGGNCGYINKRGRFSCANLEYERYGPFRDGLALIGRGSGWGYINRHGLLVIPFKYYDAGNFLEGLAFAQTEKYGYINRSGKFVIRPQFDEARYFSEGLAPVQVGDKFGYIDKTGQFIISPRFDEANEFSEGLAAVNIGGREDTMVTAKRIVIRTGVFRGGKWGYIDKTGRMVIEPQFDKSDDMAFHNGLARIQLGTIWGYINKSGQLIWQSED